MRLTAVIALLSATLAHAGANYDAAVLADTPVAWWKMNEGSGATTMIDSSGNGRNGGYVNGVSLGHPGIFGASCGDTSALYDGVNDFAQIPSDSAFHVATTGELTVEAWVWALATPLINLSAVNYGGVEPPNHFEWVMIPHNGGADWVWDILQDSGADHSFATSTTPVSTTQFQYVAGTTIDATSTKIYVSGLPEATSTSFSGTAGTGHGGAVAANDDCSHFPLPCSRNFFNAYVGQVAVYDHALSDARVLAHYNAALADIAACAATPMRHRRVYQMQ